VRPEREQPRTDRLWSTVRIALTTWRPPIDRREFWSVQALVIVIAAGHLVFEFVDPFDAHQPLYLVPMSLYVIPVMYAALNFGLRGALQTAAWCGLLSLPNVLFLHGGLERLGEGVQWLGLAGTAMVVGRRVDGERAARFDAEQREQARRVSEEQYRAIFDTVDQPLILMDEDGLVTAANAAAGALFRMPAADLLGRTLPEPFGSLAVDTSAAPGGEERLPRPAIRSRGDGAWIEAISSPFIDPSGQRQVQVILRDVTAQHEREEGLESVVRQALVAREAEQRRIARELHDGPVQSLMLLVRELDALEFAGSDVASAVEDARAVAIRVADHLRRVARDLRPSILDDLGLPTALRASAHAFTDRTGIKARIVVTGTPRRLGSDLELTLLRISEEALRNIERHSGALTANIRLRFGASDVTLVISDDGAGMSTLPSASTLVASNRLGIIGMRERARLAGGEVTIHARRPAGLTVKICVPASRTGDPAAPARDVPGGIDLAATAGRSTGP
jgi:PAS domain S-box-containing protein